MDFVDVDVWMGDSKQYHENCEDKGCYVSLEQTPAQPTALKALVLATESVKHFVVYNLLENDQGPEDGLLKGYLIHKLNETV